MNPVQGFERDGIEGFARGAVQGAAGFVLKPLSGFFDFATNTAEGVASSARVQVQERQREPRMTYGESRVVKVFQKEHAFLNGFFDQIQGLPEYVNFVDYMFDHAKRLVLVLTTEHLFVIETRDKLLQLRVSLWRVLAISANRFTLELIVVPRASGESSSCEIHFSSAEFTAAAKALVDRGLSEI